LLPIELYSDDSSSGRKDEQVAEENAEEVGGWRSSGTVGCC